MAKIIEANSTEKLLTHYTSIRQVSEGFSSYWEPGLRYYKEGTFEEIQTPDYAYNYADGEYNGVVTPGGAWEASSAYYAYPSIDLKTTVLEEIGKIENSGDKIMLYTTIPTHIFSTIAESIGFEYVDGAYLECIYTLDAKTLVILDAINTLCFADGTNKEMEHAEITYNVPRPEGAEALLARLSDPQKLRTVTLIANPGTDEESTCRSQVPKGEKVWPIFYNNEEWVLYADSACTMVYSSTSDVNADLTLYCKMK